MRLLIRTAFILVVSSITNYAFASEAMLRNFFVSVNTLQANFEQRVVDETGFTLERSSGDLYLFRPGKFRWDYLEKLEGGSATLTRQILADGESIFLYDPDLEQVTQRSLQDALGQVPSLLLVQSGADIDLHFRITDFGITDGLSWVALKPKAEDAGYQQLMIGFNDGQLSAIELLDGLGNETHLSLSNVQRNLDLDESTFQFDVPEGADLLKE